MTEELVNILFMLDEPLALEQRLAQFDLERHGGETMQHAENLGAERWHLNTKSKPLRQLP